ncbi:MAG: right-handed parallel beta-helix repeat-containing protein [Acidobacteriaceae bacterium]|nr:right-handed parallel beta-helix repeat-containing protein [Acidobacteriaceae bacterium]
MGDAPSGKPPIGFFSYVRREDQYENEVLSRIRERLSGEVGLQTGRSFEIFQDRNEIKWGQQWKLRIKDSLDTSTFLIPVLTPGFFHSPACREEVEIFLAREEELGRGDLILPIYYVDIPELRREEAQAKDKLLSIFAARQYVDWRDLRFESPTSPQVGKTLANMARQIRDVLQETGGAAPAAPKPASKADIAPVSASQPGATAKSEGTARFEPPTLIVDAMHRGDHVSIAEAVKAANPGSRILIRAGLYRESIVIDRPLEIIGDGRPGDVKIVGSETHAITFKANIGRISNLTIFQESKDDYNAVYISQGRLDLQECDISSKSLACIGIYGNADPRIRNNRIHSAAQGGVLICEQASGTLEDNEIYENALSGVEVRDSAGPTLRRNRVHDNKQSGLLFAGNAQGLLEDSDIYGNGYSGIQISGADPVIRRNKIHDQVFSGISIYNSGKGLLDENEIFANRNAGIQVREAGDPMVRNNRINRNAKAGINVLKDGRGTFERNNLKENGGGPWQIDEASLPLIKRAHNIE